MKFLHSKNRLESVSDAVFAFAATLMVVNLGANSSITSFYEDLPNFLSFAVSFFVMMAIWKLHYNYFRRTEYIDNWTITFNMVLLFMVLFYIFPIRSLLNTGTGAERISLDQFSNIFQLYSIGFSLIFVCFSMMYLRAYNKTKEVQLLFYCRHFGIFVAVGIISAILAKLQVGLQYGVPGFIYAFLGPLCYIHSKQFLKKHPKASY